MRRIQESVGFWVFNYNLYKRWYHMKPDSIDDFFDGLECIPIFQELETKW